ncbi:hypothetical protein [Haloferax sulfurifontis]|uniref:hypothetical protein n=1 Tax=Haloferax sulfurifontis TaxID=255616 RepID=UPI001EF9E09C|nr:hypothetical protein [Haloferax sulfurifontis]
MLLGYSFGFKQGDLWIGIVLTLVWTISGYGFLAFPQYRTRWSGSHNKFWYTILGVLTPIIMLFPQHSSLLTEGLTVMLLLGGIWIGGVYAGIALEQTSTAAPET